MIRILQYCSQDCKIELPIPACLNDLFLWYFRFYSLEAEQPLNQYQMMKNSASSLPKSVLDGMLKGAQPLPLPTQAFQRLLPRIWTSTCFHWVPLLFMTGKEIGSQQTPSVRTSPSSLSLLDTPPQIY